VCLSLHEILHRDDWYCNPLELRVHVVVTAVIGRNAYASDRDDSSTSGTLRTHCSRQRRAHHTMLAARSIVFEVCAKQRAMEWISLHRGQSNVFDAASSRSHPHGNNPRRSPRLAPSTPSYHARRTALSKPIHSIASACQSPVRVLA
jgi:hypothetical protein